jgi:hypothetical protein
MRSESLIPTTPHNIGEKSLAPLMEIPGLQILAARQSRTEFQEWPSREDGPNRVEPIAKPHFDTLFSLIPGENIFTIGSCFARNVEAKLLDRNFKIPALDIFKSDVFKGIDPSALNNYGVPSIYQELAWALDPDFPFDPHANFSELLPGKFVDNHLPPGIRPVSREIVEARREAVRQANAKIKECRVVIITLGLTEVWYDKTYNVYLNTHPRLKMLQDDPQRYALRVLSFDQTIHYLRKIAGIIGRFGHPETQIIITVSPVPMGSTHRPTDVMVANTYSKSVLRAATEQIVMEQENVHYYPSYESFILSSRERAYKYDMVHAEQELVDINVGRMVSGYAGSDQSAAELSDEDLVGYIRETSRGNSRLKWNLLVEHERRIPTSPAFAVEYIHSTLSRKEFKLARSVLERAPGPWAVAQRELLEAAILIGERKFAEAKALLESLNFSRVDRLSGQGRMCFFHLVEANIGLKDLDAARDDAFVFARDVVKGGGRNRVYEMLARGYKDVGRLTDAAHFYAQAIETNGSEMTMVDYAEVLISLRNWDAAKAILEKVIGANPLARRRKQHLMSFMPV